MCRASLGYIGKQEPNKNPMLSELEEVVNCEKLSDLVCF